MATKSEAAQTLAELLPQLRAMLDKRQMRRGTTLLDASENQLRHLDPHDPAAAPIVLCLAQWVDAGYRDEQYLGEILSRYTSETLRELTITDYLRIRMAAAFRCLVTEDIDSAIATLGFILHATDSLGDSVQALALSAHFWKGRAHRKKGEYELALRHIVAAGQIAAQMRAKRIARAVIQVQEAWLLFQKGAAREALDLYDVAERELQHVDHALVLGNIASARGRIVRRAGEYTSALAHFQRAIEIYSTRYASHRNLARALMNAAYVERLLALELRRRIDDRAEHRGISRAARRGMRQHSDLHTQYSELCAHALDHLRRAGEIYKLHEHYTGMGAVRVNTGYLLLDQGQHEEARSEASNAYEQGAEKRDLILMARARVLEAYVELFHVEEEVGDEAESASHIHAAVQFSNDALELGRQTQNNRLIASAWIAKGLAVSNEFFQDWELARHCADEAASLLHSEDRDHLTQELARLKARILRSGGIDDMLRAWSEGIVGDKSFQQIAEEFAELVIPRVWIREDRKVARVAERLSISPKKVRRVLRNTGLLNDGAKEP